MHQCRACQLPLPMPSSEPLQGLRGDPANPHPLSPAVDALSAPASLPTAAPAQSVAVSAEGVRATARAAVKAAAGIRAADALALGRWARPALLAAGGLVAVDGLAHLLQPGSGMALGLGALAGGWWLLGERRPNVRPRRPADLQGWIARCEELIPQFARLAADPAVPERRRAELGRLGLERAAEALQLGLVGGEPSPSVLQQGVASCLRGSRALQLHLGHPLATAADGWRWPEGLAAADALLFQLTPPLRASELRWLEAVPSQQPLWLLLHPLDPESVARHRDDLLQQWPAADPVRLLGWDGDPATLETSLAPLADWLRREGAQLRSRTARRRLEALHQRWQADLEQLRRQQWQQLLRRTQWSVAAGVLLAPLPSLDLLVLATANGLMLREMAQLWDCPWTLEQLRAAAGELARAALAQGVVEWSSQALATAVKLHGATWLVGGSLQALSAAYLTRVVGRAMADTLALSAGVAEPDLERIRREAPLLVARAAEQERLDWGDFLRQGRRWWQQQAAATAG